jgi:5-methylcytosine-specific restriction enzyme subunit McrC
VTETLRLVEYEEREISLASEDAAYLARAFAKQIALRRALTGEGYLLNPNQFVGVLALPSGRRLQIEPKVPVRSLFFMLAVASELPPPFLEEAAEFAELDELLEFVAGAFADLAEERIARGLYRAYVEREENLAAVRGRIAVADDLRRNHVLRHRTFCRFAELTEDVPENRIVRQVAHLLAGWVRRPPLRLRLWRIDHALGSVAPTHLPAEAVDRFAYGRLNEEYRPLHRLCKLVLEWASFADEAGPFAFRAFLLDMNRLFERFVTQTLRDRARHPVSVDDQVPLHLAEGRRVDMRPDLVVRVGTRPTLVADCKYKRLEPEGFKGHDLYQILAYCTALGLDRGLLVYPRHDVPVADAIRVVNSAVRIRQVSLDLSGSLAEIRAACDRLARVVLVDAVAPAAVDW